MANSAADEPGFKTRNDLEASRSCSSVSRTGIRDFSGTLATYTHFDLRLQVIHSSSQRLHLRSWCSRPAATPLKKPGEKCSASSVIGLLCLRDSGLSKVRGRPPSAWDQSWALVVVLQCKNCSLPDPNHVCGWCSQKPKVRAPLTLISHRNVHGL